MGPSCAKTNHGPRVNQGARPPAERRIGSALEIIYDFFIFRYRGVFSSSAPRYFLPRDKSPVAISHTLGGRTALVPLLQRAFSAPSFFGAMGATKIGRKKF